jgi:hypothetical protein
MPAEAKAIAPGFAFARATISRTERSGESRFTTATAGLSPTNTTGSRSRSGW